MSAISIPENVAVEETVAAILAGKVDTPDLATWDAPLQRKACLATLGRAALVCDDPAVFAQDALVRATRVLECDHYTLAFAQNAGRANVRWGTIFPDVLGDGAGEQEIELGNTKSATAFAMKEGHPVVLASLANECRFRDPVLQRLEVASGVVCTLGAANDLLGALGVYTRNERTFKPEEVLFLENVAQLVGTALLRVRAEKKVVGQGRFISTVMDATDCIVLVLGLDGSVLRLNRAGQEITGFSAAEVRQRAIWSAFLIPEETALVKQAFDRLRKGEESVRLECYVLTKSGERRRVNWTFALLHGDGAASHTIVATGIDITEQIELAKRLDTAEEAAANARATLGELKKQLESGEARLTIEGGVDRRTSRRRAFPHIQIVAPVVEERLPTLTEFCEIRCRDISSKGFSFLTPTPYGHKQIVIGFGPSPSHLYLLADVMHVTPYVYSGRQVYLVGCRYKSRVSYGAGGAKSADDTDVMEA